MTENEETNPVVVGESDPEIGSEKPKRKKASKSSYRALTGLSYGEKLVEAGEVVNDIPEVSVEWLLESGAIEKVED